MGIPKLSFKHPVITRAGSKVRFYHIYQHEIHGAYEAGDGDWKICRWNLDGRVNADGGVSSCDLINEWVENLPEVA